jgi:hypothetical protein
VLSRSAAITELLRAWSGGDGTALNRLADEVYNELRRMARRYMKNERQLTRYRPQPWSMKSISACWSWEGRPRA